MQAKEIVKTALTATALVAALITLGMPAAVRETTVTPYRDSGASQLSPGQFRPVPLGPERDDRSPPPGAEGSLLDNEPPERTPLDALIEQGEILEEERSPSSNFGWFKRNRLVRVRSLTNLIEVEDEVRDDADGERVRERVAWTAEHVLVRPREEVDPNEFAQLVGGAVEAILPTIGAVVLKLPAELQRVGGAQEAIKELQTHGALQFAERDYIVYSTRTPNDARYGELWGLHNTGQSGGQSDADIDAPEAWGVSTGSSSMVVGIIDTGVDYNHPDLAANMWQNPGEIPGNSIDDDGNGYIDDVYGYDFANLDADPMDDQYHGTHCAGTVGAVGNNGIGVVGVSWSAKLMALKFMDSSGSGLTSRAALAVAYATSMGVKITSNSWGGGGFSSTLYSVIDYANSEGAHFVAAAGNSALNNDTGAFYPASYDIANVISVASTNRYDALSSFSNYGVTTVDVGAPGSSILSTIPGGTYEYLSGTSMATPHVVGVLSVLHANQPTLSRAMARSIIESSVRTIPALAGKTVTGGVVNLEAALMALAPSPTPTQSPTVTTIPSVSPTATSMPTAAPTESVPPSPSATPTPPDDDGFEPPTPSATPTPVWSATPTSSPEPTIQPTAQPTAEPQPTLEPTIVPTPLPTSAPAEALIALSDSILSRGRSVPIQLKAQSPHTQPLAFSIVRRPSFGALLPVFKDQLSVQDIQWMPYRRDLQTGEEVPLVRRGRVWTADGRPPSSTNLPHFGEFISVGMQHQLVVKLTSDRNEILAFSPVLTPRRGQRRAAGADGVGITVQWNGNETLFPRTTIPPDGSLRLRSPLLVPLEAGSTVSVAFDAGANSLSDTFSARLFYGYSSQYLYTWTGSRRSGVDSFTFQVADAERASNIAAVSIINSSRSSAHRSRSRHERLREREARRVSRSSKAG